MQMDFLLEFSSILSKDTLMIPVHAVARVKHKLIINEGFNQYLNRVQKINSAYKGSLHQWLRVVFFELCDCNAGPVYGIGIARSVLNIDRELPFPVDLSP